MSVASWRRRPPIRCRAVRVNIPMGAPQLASGRRGKNEEPSKINQMARSMSAMRTASPVHPGAGSADYCSPGRERRCIYPSDRAQLYSIRPPSRTGIGGNLQLCGKRPGPPGRRAVAGHRVGGAFSRWLQLQRLPAATQVGSGCISQWSGERHMADRVRSRIASISLGMRS